MIVVLAALLAAGVTAFWNAVKPMPLGTHVASLPARLSEGDVEFLDEAMLRDVISRRSIALIERAEQLIVIDQSPLPREFTAHLLARQRQRPHLKILVITDPRDERYGGTSAMTLSTLEAAGIVVVRTGLGRLRDSNPLYSSGWRLVLGWWSTPFAETPGRTAWLSGLRQLNDKADERRLLVADDGAGDWSSLIASRAGVALVIRRHLARDIAASELAIAAWSADDDRLPEPPPVPGRGLGSIDARFLTEGAVLAVLRDALGAAGSGDAIDIAVAALTDRQLIDELLRATRRGARCRLLLDPYQPANRAVAGELRRAGGAAIEVRWAEFPPAGLLLVRHATDVWLEVGSADLTRRDLDDLNLEAHLELHLPARAQVARAAGDAFGRQWSNGLAYATHADASRDTYWKYRISEATGLALF
jgi:hypothetical protein